MDPFLLLSVSQSNYCLIKLIFFFVVQLDKSSGSSIDWVHDKANVKVAFAIELRDKGEYNFLMPKNEIKPASEELWNGLQAVLKDM